MLSGPSTAFSYKPSAKLEEKEKRRKKAYGHPTVLVCPGCNAWVVGLYSPTARRRVFAQGSRFFAAPSLVYSFEKHGAPHFCPQLRHGIPRISP